MDGEHAEGVGQGDLAANAPNAPNAPKKPKGPKTPKAPQKWSELKREEKAFIVKEAVRGFDAYVAERGSKPYSRAVYLVAVEVCRAAREGGITLPKRIMESHVLKILAKLAKGGSYLEMSTRRVMKK